MFGHYYCQVQIRNQHHLKVLIENIGKTCQSLSNYVDMKC